jgi:uncharacterized membrane protein YhaH (DUF805 family)
MANYFSIFIDVITKRYAQFTGRADRKEFWTFTIIYAVIMWILQIIMTKMPSFIAFLIMAILLGIIALALLVPTIALGVRRLHDLGKGGGWICINFIPIVGSIWYLVLTLMPGEPAENRFGQPQP